MICVTGCESESERIIREGEEARQKIKDASDHYENLKRQISDLQSLQTYRLLTLFAANTPHIAIDATLLAPLIIFTFLLLHFGHLTAVSIGAPHAGHIFATSDTSRPHSGQLIKAIPLFLPCTYFYNTTLSYFIRIVNPFSHILLYCTKKES